MKTKPEDACCAVGAAAWDTYDSASKPALARYYRAVFGQPWVGRSPLVVYEAETAPEWETFMDHRRQAHPERWHMPSKFGGVAGGGRP
jgi:hypothetical protein